MLTIASLGPVEFQKILSDLSSGHNKWWWIPLLLFQTLEEILIPLFSFWNYVLSLRIIW